MEKKIHVLNVCAKGDHTIGVRIGNTQREEKKKVILYQMLISFVSLKKEKFHSVMLQPP